MPATQADFFRRLQQETVELVDGTVESRFRTRLTQIRNDVAAASALINRAAVAERLVAALVPILERAYLQRHPG